MNRQFAAKLLDRGIALARITRQGAAKNLIHARGQVRVQAPRGSENAPGQLPRQQLISHHREGEQIAALVGGQAETLLRRTVVKGALGSAQSGQASRISSCL